MHFYDIALFHFEFNKNLLLLPYPEKFPLRLKISWKYMSLRSRSEIYPEYCGNISLNDTKRFSIVRFVNFTASGSKISAERENLGTPTDLLRKLIWIGYSSSTNGWRNLVSVNVPISLIDWKWKDPRFGFSDNEFKNKLLD